MGIIYNEGSLKAVADDSIGCHHVKLYWKENIIAAAPSLMACLENAYVGIRVFSLKHRTWLTNEERVESLRALDRAILLVDGKIRNKEGMEKNMRLGISWYLDDNKQVEVKVRLTSKLDLMYFNSDIFSYDVKVTRGLNTMTWTVDAVDAMNMLESLKAYYSDKVTITAHSTVTFNCDVTLVDGKIETFLLNDK